MNASESGVGARLSRVVAILAILASLVVVAVNVTRWPFTSNGTIFKLMYAGGVGGGALGYLLLQSTSEDTHEVSLPTARTLYKVQAAIFFACFGTILLILDGVFYVKPSVYYLLVGIWGASLIWTTAVSRLSSSTVRWWLLGQTIVLGTVTLSASPVINPFLTGPDAYWHFNHIIQAVDAARLTEASGHYYYYFVFHLSSAAVIQLSGSAASAFSSLTVLWGIVMLPTVYLLVRIITASRRPALVSAQLLALNTLLIFGVINKSPTYLGFLFVFVAASVVFKSDSFTAVQSWACFFVVGFGAFFTHFVTSINLAAFLGVYTGYLWVSKRGDAYDVINTRAAPISKSNVQVGIVPFASYIAAVLVYHVFIHTFVAGHILATIFVSGDSAALPSAQPQPIRVIELLQYGFGFSGIVSLLFLATVGSLSWIDDLAPKRLQVTVWFGLLNLLGIVYLFIGAAGGTLRLVLSAVVVAVILGAVGITQFISRPLRRPKLRFGILMLFVLVFTLAAPASYLTWDGNGVFNEEIETPTNFVRSSLVATHDFLTRLPKGTQIAIDSRSAVYITNSNRGLRAKPENIDVKCLDCSGVKRTDEILQSGYRLVNEARSGQLTPNIPPSSSVVYTNGDIHIFLNFR